MDIINNDKLNNYIFIAEFPFKCENNIFPPEREKEINLCKNEKIKNSKFYAWKLLELAINNIYSKKIEDFNFKKINNKWICKGFYFSISHSENIISVAISQNNIGIDIQFFNKINYSNKFAKYILSENEYVNYLIQENKELYLAKMWSNKESTFKKSNDLFLYPKKREVLNEKCENKIIKINNNEFILSINSENNLINKINLINISGTINDFN